MTNLQNAENAKVSASRLEVAGERRANLRSRNFRRMVIWGSIIAALAILAAIAGYLYLNRERPVVTLHVAAGPYRSDSYELMKEVADVVGRQSEILRIDVIATKDSSQNIALLNAGEKRVGNGAQHLRGDDEILAAERLALEEKSGQNSRVETAENINTIVEETIPVDLATIRSDTPVASNVRMIADLFPDYFQLISGMDSGISRVGDLEGKRVAIPPFGTDEFRSFWAVGDHYDLSITGVKWVAMPFVDAVDKMLTGELDAIFTVRSLRDRLVLNMFEDASLKNFRLRIIEIDQAPAIALKRPFLSSNTIPKGTYGGQPPVPFSDTVSSAVVRTLVSREDIDAELVRELTRILFENRLDLTIRFALASAISQPGQGVGLSVPLHDGAQQYYDRDQPSFLQENAEPIALILTIVAGMFSGLLALRSRLMSGQKNRMDSYNYMLLDIADKARGVNERAEIKLLKNELYGILEKVVRALDADEVTEEGFQSFSLLWESVREVLNDRAEELRHAEI